MDEWKRLSPSSGRASASFPRQNDPSAELWHSTPVKKKNGGASLDSSYKMENRAAQWVRSGAADSLDTDFPVNDPSVSTIQRQRRELQLLISELKDRDSELNSMSSSHRQQITAWEKDRQKLLALEQKSGRLDDELQKRNEVIRVLTKRVWVVENREVEVKKELSVVKQQLSELEDFRMKCQDFEEKNQSLNSTIMSLSTKLGSLQVREEELSSMLKLKDRDVSEASGHVSDLNGRLRELENSLSESRMREKEILRDCEENKQRYREARHEVSQLKEELQLQVTQSSTQREEIIRLKQELQLLRRDLALAGEGDVWREELLELTRSKQERTASELRCLRQVCENQRNDLQLLQLNLESAREAVHEASGQRLPARCICAKNSRCLYDVTAVNSPPAANSEPGVFSLSIHGDDPLSSCFLQQLLDESRHPIGPDHSHSHRLPAGNRERETLYSERFPLPNTSTHQVSETPPRTPPLNRRQPSGRFDSHISPPEESPNH